MPFRISRTKVGSTVLMAFVAGAVYLTLSHSNGAPSSQPGGPVAGVDFSDDQDANLAAAAQGDLITDLNRFDSFAITQIVSSGIEVELVGPPTAAILAVVARDDPKYQGKPIPISYRSVPHNWRELQALVDRIATDVDYWHQQGIEPTSWGYGASNVVEIGLAHYTKAYGTALLARYGSDWVTVYTEDHDVTG